MSRLVGTVVNLLLYKVAIFQNNLRFDSGWPWSIHVIRNRCLECRVLEMSLFTVTSTKLFESSTKCHFSVFAWHKEQGSSSGCPWKIIVEEESAPCGLGCTSVWVTGMALGLPRTGHCGSAYYHGASNLCALSQASSSEWGGASLPGVLPLAVVLQGALPGGLHCCQDAGCY